MPFMIDLNQYRSNEFILIKDLPFQICASDRIDFVNHDKTTVAVYFIAPNGRIIGPCKTGCYLPTKDTGVPITKLGKRKSDIVTVFLGEKLLSYSEVPIKSVFSLEHGISQEVSLKYNLTVSLKLNPRKVEDFIDFIMENHESSLYYATKQVKELIKVFLNNHSKTMLDNSFAKSSSELSTIIADICNDCNNLTNQINFKLANAFKFFIAQISSLEIICPQAPTIIELTNSVPSTIHEGEIKTLEADIQRDIKDKDNQLETRIKNEDSVRKMKEKMVDTQLAIMQKQSELYATMINSLSEHGMEKEDILVILQKLPHPNIITPELQEFISSKPDNSDNNLIE